MTVTTYDPKSVTCTIGESYLVGWNSISIVRNSPVFNKINGIRGKHTRTSNYDTSASLRLALPFASEWNYYLSEILNQDSVSGTGRLEIMLKDGSGTSLFHTLEAYIVGFPDVTFDGGLSERVWNIQCLSMKTYIVGNTVSPIGSILDSINSGLSDLF